MDWLVIIGIGAVIGTLVGIFGDRFQMPQSLCILVAIVGALAGGALAKLTEISTIGSWTFYAMAAVLSLGFSAGGILGFSLTSEEKHV